MIPLNPIFLWLLPLAALPILWHLFLRVKKRTRVFSTLLFFRKADPRLSSRKKIREWLTLLLRALAILLLLLALARLVWLGHGGGGSVSAVLLIDNSGSMTARNGGQPSKLSDALAAAHAIVTDLGEGDTAAILTLVEDPSAELPEGFLGDKPSLKAAIGRIAPTQAAGSPGDALTQAFTLLGDARGSRLEIHIFSDLQAGEWGRAVPLEKRPPTGTAIIIHRFDTPPRTAPNVAVTGVSLPQTRLVAGRKLTAEVSLLNSSDMETKVRLNGLDDSGTQFTREVGVAPYTARNVPIPLQQSVPGLHWLRAWIDDEAFEADNEAYLAYACKSRETVLFLGSAGDFGLLAPALSPTGRGSLSGIQVRTEDPAALDSVLTEDAPVMVVMGWSDVAGAGLDAPDAALRRYVESGGVLLIALNGVEPVDAGAVPEWIAAAPGALVSDESGLSAVVFEKEDRLWQDLRDDQGEVLLRNVRIRRCEPLTLSDGARALLGLEDGRPLLSVTPLRYGSVYACGLAFSAEWSTLPLKGGFLALAQSMALTHPPIGTNVVSLVAGQRIPESADLEGVAEVTVVKGAPIAWKGPVGALPVLPRAGVYALQAGDVLKYVAVRADDHEDREQYVTDPRVPLLGSVSHTVIPFEGASSMLARITRLREGLDMFLPLLLAALVAVVLEGFVANPKPRTHAAASGTPSPANREAPSE